MSIVCVQVGQCGNQVGQGFLSCIHQDAQRANERGRGLYAQSSLQRFFRPLSAERASSHCARAVLVDTEAKVVQQMHRDTHRHSAWRYPESREEPSIKHGSGNNWALGYFLNGPSMVPLVMESVRREVERCDCLEGFITFMSGAGGTGSGLGSLVSEALREEYTNKYRLNQLIWPHQASRDVIIQDYNLIFTLASLYRCSDAILAVQNDHVHSICSRVLGLKDFSLPEMNQVIAHLLGSVFQPSQDLEWSRLGAQCRPLTTPLSDIVTHLCWDPAYKLLGVRGVPLMRSDVHAYSTFLWESLIKTLRQMSVTNSPIDLGLDWSYTKTQEHLRNRSLGNYLILRGKDSFLADPALFEDNRLYYTHMRSSPLLQTRYNAHSFNGYDKSSTLVSNDQLHLPALEASVKSVWKLFHSRAYIHHFTEKGMEEREIFDKFVQAEQVISDYASLA